jgi:lysophospholipase L1-like esterase
MYRAVTHARAHARLVLIVNQPYLTQRWVEEQRVLQEMLAERFASDRLVHYLDLGWSVDLHDPSMAYDGVHLTPRGNQHIADLLADYTEELLKTSHDARH